MPKIIDQIVKALKHPKAAIYLASQRYIRKYEGFSYNFYANGEAFVMDSLSTYLTNSITFDVGANRGDWSRMVSSRSTDCVIYAFEPSPTTFRSFLEPSTLGISTIKCCNIGLGSVDSLLPFKEYLNGDALSTFVTKADFHSLESSIVNVEVKTGDRFCQANNIDKINFLKIDVEGFEFDVLKGFEDMISDHCVDLIQFEYGYTNADSGHILKDMYKFLTDKGYAVGPIKPKGVIFMDFDYALNNFNSGPNFLAVSPKASHLVEVLRGPAIPFYPSR